MRLEMPATVEQFPIPETTFEHSRAQCRTALFGKKENELQVTYYFRVI